MALQPKTNIVVTKPAPVGGLNARDALSAMPETDAVELINWIPDAYGLRSRKGFREWSTGMGAPVKSVMAYFGPSATYSADILSNPTEMPGNLFAATDAAIYDCTTRGAGPSSSRALSGTENAGWLSSALLTNIAGTFLCTVSEVDGYFHWNGTAWATPTAGVGAGQIANVDPANFCFVTKWKRRLWFVEKNSTRAWYLPVDQITGSAVSLDLGALMTSGGHLSYIATWTIDAGEGIDDFLVIVGSNGDVMIYKGTDPSSAATFQLVGTWQVGQIPVGRRAFCQYGGDLVLLSADGVFPISYVTRGGAGLLVASSKEYSSKIRVRIGPILRKSFTSRGWAMALHPSERLLMVSMPSAAAHKNSQFAMNTTLNEWCQLQDVPMSCMGFTAGYMFTGDADGRLLLVFDDALDEVPLDDIGGNGIYGVIQPAYTNFGLPALQKMCTMLRAHFLAASAPGVSATIAVNYSGIQSRVYPNYAEGSAARWDSARWDQARWASQDGGPHADWVGVGGVGSAISAILFTGCAGDTVMTAIDYMYQPGGPL